MTHGIIWYQDISADTVDINQLHLVVARHGRDPTFSGLRL